jgi:endonuclease YncB( thermonuclease family)
MMRLSVPALAHTRRGEVVLLAAATFAFGLILGARLVPWLDRPAASPPPASTMTAPARTVPALPLKFDSRLAYPAQVVRVIDGDTFEARVRVWPGLDVDTKVRLRGIDAPELHARCSDEYARAQSARTALEAILAEGGVAVSRVGLDKYGGRIDALASTSATADVSAALLNGGFARSYDGGKRGTWC